MMKNIKKLFISALTFLFLLISCKQEQNFTDKPYDIETAKMVSTVTGGLLSSNEAIKVVFTNDMVKEGQVGVILKKSVFDFDPTIDGVTKWQDRKTLIFQPNQTLPFRETYAGTLDMEVLFPEYVDKSLKPLSINFQVAGREIENFTEELKLKNENDPKYVIFEGIITFTEETELEKVERATQLKLSNRNVTLKWKKAASQKQFSVVSQPIVRNETEQSLTLKIDRSGLDLSYDYVKTIALPSIEDLKIVDIIRSDDGKQPELKIQFSDELNSEQDIRGFVNFNPEIETQLKVLGKTILVHAPFSFGQTYVLTVKPGIKSRWATKLNKEFKEDVSFEDMLPQMKFSRDGVFLPSANQKKISFMTANLRGVQLRIIKVFESNLGYFLQMENLDGNAERRDNFPYNIERVGIEIAQKDLVIGSTKNRWLQHEIDLNKLISKDQKGLFLVEIKFRQQDMIYDTSEDNLQYRRQSRDYYYNDPSSRGYIWRHGQIFKPVIYSDIGLIYKKGEKQHTVYATNLLDSKPISGVVVRLKTYQNQLIAEGKTDGKGIASFNNVDKTVFYVEAEKNNQRSVIKPNEMMWNLSTFDVGGERVNSEGTRVFLYSDRGVHRPGDTIFLSAIIRNENNTFPDNHPILLNVTNPKNQTVHQETNRNGTDGFYCFQIKTKPEDLTGNYTALITAGSKQFTTILPIETVVPERLKVTLTSPQKTFNFKAKYLVANLKSTYLFGNPAANLDAEISVSISSVNKSFKKYSDYNFTNQATNYQTMTSTIFKNKLDLKGEAKTNWKLPDFSGVPSALKMLLRAEVWEKGGRSSKNQLTVNTDPYPYYVGIKKPDFKYWYAQTNQDYLIPMVVLSAAGLESPGRTVYYKIYRNEYNWWWEYDSREQYRLKFKNSRSTELVKSGTIISGSTPTNLTFRPEERGEYLIEFQDGENTGHISSFFIRAYPWGETPSSGKDAGVLAIKTDKTKYNPGDEAVVSFPVPKQATILFTLEKGDKVLKSEWLENNDDTFEKNVKISITDDLLPTAYASIAILQPHSQTENDRPIRMFGIVPINVEKSSTHHKLKIKMKEELQPEEEFEIEIQTADKKETQLTVAVVDEGLLSLTRFKTPDAWQSFFKKMGLGVQSYDLYNHVIGVNKGDIFRTFSVGGGLDDLEYRDDQLEQQKAKRFKAVVMFEGPLKTDDEGKAKVKFTMPNYIGAVRVMVVSANKNRYGKAEKTVAVKSDLMVLPTLPRVIGHKDKIVVPITVFAMKENIGEVRVKLETEGPLQVSGNPEKVLQLNSIGEKDVQFTIKADPAVGIAKILISAQSKNLSTNYDTEISVRSSSPRITETINNTLEPGESISMIIPDKGLKGSSRAILSIQRRPNLKLTRRLLWLIRYPYGCIEQTVSSVFPQLYLMEFLPKSRAAKRDIDKNINAAIDRLHKFQLPSGGFAYWPGSNSVSNWGTSYAGHFLIEAKKLGYNVPDVMLKKWIRYQKSQVLQEEKYLMMQIYRMYTLSLAGESSIGGMNVILENKLDKMSDVQKWLLAVGYQLSGAGNAVDRILAGATLSVDDYNEFSNTYGSTLRDKSFILEQLIVFERWNEANLLANEISVALSSQEWYSTQTSAFMLMALGKYFKAIEGDSEESPIIAGTITQPDGKEVSIDTEEINYQLEIESGFGKNVYIELDKRTTIKRAFVDLEWSGLPLEYLGQDSEKNIQLTVEWFDEDGMMINPASTKQGQTFYAHFQINKPKAYRNDIEEVALVQVLPAGWEIVNTRLSGESQPKWTRNWRLNREEYLDIRDDRTMWFFDLDRYSRTVDFLVKLNAVTVGEFILPPTLVEAMYNNSYGASKAGRAIRVESR